MSFSQSRPRVINDETYSFINKDGELLGISKKDASGIFKPLDNSSVEYSNIKNSEESLDAFRKAVYGGDKDAYTDTITFANDEEQTNYFLEASKKINNEQFQKAAITSGNVSDTGGNGKGSAKKGKYLYRYPINFDISQDHLKITRYEYRRPDVNMSKGAVDMKVTAEPGEGDDFSAEGGNPLFGEKKRARSTADSVLGELLGTVYLPMPKVADVNGVEWGKSELTISGLAGLGAVEKLAAITGGTGKSEADKKKDEDALEDLRASLGKESGRNVRGSSTTEFVRAAKIQILSGLAGALTGSNLDADTFFARTSGRVLNPNAEVLFQGPVIRDFSFSFVMIARSEKEGAEIRKIIRSLKLGMAPKFRSTTFLKNPDVFMLEYQSGGKTLNTVNRFNPGGLALQTMSVDYAPNGYWSAYKDSQPVAIKMDLSFTELRPIYQSDQEDTPEDSVGL